MPAKSPTHPFYIPSKGRYNTLITSQSLTDLGIRHYLVVEPQQVELYEAGVFDRKLLATVLPLDMSYKDHYELCDDLGHVRSTGPGSARNFAWDHSISLGHAWHWVMDDNIQGFYRMTRNLRVRVASPSIWRAMEEFVARFSNVAMAGPNYTMFAFGASALPPFITNTRIYSCNLIRNDVPFRWRGRYNEDTILSLDMLKAGWCTVQFNAFLQQKLGTQKIAGGNTAEFYHAEGATKNTAGYTDTGTYAKSKMLVDVHPDCSQMVFKFNRWHHHVDYSRFKNMPLQRAENVKPGIDNYGMELVRVNVQPLQAAHKIKRRRPAAT